VVDEIVCAAIALEDGAVGEQPGTTESSIGAEAPTRTTRRRASSGLAMAPKSACHPPLRRVV